MQEKAHARVFFDALKKFNGENINWNNLYIRDEQIKWMCTNCGYIYEGKEPPLICPVCSYLQEYYMDFSTKEYE